MPRDGERQDELRGVSRELQLVHRSLMEISRERYELANGPLRSKGQLLELVLHDEAFAWLRSLSRLIVEIDELLVRDPIPTEADASAMGARVTAFISPSEDRDAFGSRYTSLLASEPHVTMAHVGLRDALSKLGSTPAADRR